MSAGATAGVKWSVIGQFENVARKGDRGPVPSRQAAKKTVRDIEEDARRSPALPLRPFSCTFGTALALTTNAVEEIVFVFSKIEAEYNVHGGSRDYVPTA